MLHAHAPVSSEGGYAIEREPLEPGRRTSAVRIACPPRAAGEPAPAHVETLPLDLVVRGTTRPAR